MYRVTGRDFILYGSHDDHPKLSYWLRRWTILYVLVVLSFELVYGNLEVGLTRSH